MTREYDENLWKRIRGYMGSDCRKAESDIGSLKVGNADFHFFIPNGYGDGVTRYILLDKEPEWEKEFGLESYIFEITGTAYIYNWDVGTERDRAEVIPVGRYVAKSYEGLVLIYKLSDVDERHRFTNLKDARNTVGISQQRASELLGVPKRTIENWESGVTTPPEYVEKLILKEYERMI